MRGALQGIAGFAVFVVLCVAGWFVYWNVHKANLDQNNQANHQSQQYQDALISQERDRVQGYDAATDKTQKAQIASTFCQVYPNITHPPTDLVQAEARICH